MSWKPLFKTTLILVCALAVEVAFALPCARSRMSGDLNGDGFVSLPDFAGWALTWLGTECSDSQWCDCADMDFSGDVGTGDAISLASRWLTNVSVFDGTLLLGSPTDHSVTVSILSGEELEVYLEYGVESGLYTTQTDPNIIDPNVPFEMTIEPLEPNTRYYYRMNWRRPGGAEFVSGWEYSFHTQRPAGNAFVFTVQADPHLGDSNNHNQLYEVALRNALADAPDFHIDLGDTFMTEKFTGGTYPEAMQMALDHRPYFDVISRDVPLFLVNGNHESELGWRLDGTSDNMAISGTLARRYYYPTPAPGGFYSGSSTVEPYVGIRDGYYGWTWSDALFLVLDPFWYTTTKPNSSGDCWDWTLGFEQYTWLKNTLEQSDAEFKFVFIHNLFGTTNGRGGIETAGYYEWGGLNVDETWGLTTRRPGWDVPIHDLLVANNVSVVFHGHDHLFIKQNLDGIVYQLMPRPGIRNYTGIKQAQNYGYVNGDVLPNTGYARVSISASQATVDYVRAYLPEDEDAQQINGSVAYTYTIPATP